MEDHCLSRVDLAVGGGCEEGEGEILSQLAQHRAVSAVYIERARG